MRTSVITNSSMMKVRHTMTSMGERTGKREYKVESIVQTLRQRIVRGHYRPGSKLPTWEELEREFDVTRTTLNRVFGQLKQDGFVYADSTRGTLVSSHPPHLCRCALIFPNAPDEKGWNRFWRTLDQESSMVAHQRDLDMIRLYGMSDVETNPARARLFADVEAYRLAGMVLVGHPEMIERPVLTREGLPKVGIWGPREDTSIPSLYVDRDAFLEGAVSHLASRGRKRIAALTTQYDRFPKLPEVLAAKGLSYRPGWHLAATGEVPDTVRPLLHLLLDPSHAERPDGLIIADDNLFEEAVAGLLEVGVRVPTDLDVVTSCNWPQESRSVLPIRRLGFDVREVLGTALDLLDAQRHGRPTPAHTRVPPRFEEAVS